MERTCCCCMILSIPMDREVEGGSVINHGPSSGGGNGDTIVHMKNELARSAVRGATRKTSSWSSSRMACHTAISP